MGHACQTGIKKVKKCDNLTFSEKMGNLYPKCFQILCPSYLPFLVKQQIQNNVHIMLSLRNTIILEYSTYVQWHLFLASLLKIGSTRISSDKPENDVPFYKSLLELYSSKQRKPNKVNICHSLIDISERNSSNVIYHLNEWVIVFMDLFVVWFK